MIEFSDIFDLVDKKPTALYFIPAAIFGYLFHLIDDLVFLSVAVGWAVGVSLLLGVERSIHYPIIDDELALPDKYDTEIVLRNLLLVVYMLYIGPLAILAALNNLVPENQEIYFTDGFLWYLFTTEIPYGVYAADDLTLLILLGIHLVSYTIIAGPTLLYFLIMWAWLAFRLLIWLLKVILRNIL